MLLFITEVYVKFLSFMTDWKIWQLVAFAVAVPLVTLFVQMLVYSSWRVYAKAYSRLRKFLRTHSYLSPSTVFSFNKKVVKVFPRYIKRQTKHIADSAMPMEEYLNTFSFCELPKKKSIVGRVAIAHILLCGILLAMQGYAIGVVSLAILACVAIWAVAIAIDRVVGKLYSAVDRRYKKKFITKLDANTAHEEKQVDLTMPKVEVSEDSVIRLADSVEEFLASGPDKSIAKVVLKGIYSAKFSSAMTAQSKLRLKNIVDELKNYVG